MPSLGFFVLIEMRIQPCRLRNICTVRFLKPWARRMNTTKTVFDAIPLWCFLYLKFVFLNFDKHRLRSHSVFRVWFPKIAIRVSSSHTIIITFQTDFGSWTILLQFITRWIRGAFITVFRFEIRSNSVSQTAFDERRCVNDYVDTRARRSVRKL